MVKTLCNVVWEVPGNTAHEKLLYNVVQEDKHLVRINTLCNLVREAPDNIAQEKILFNVVLLLLKQHCTCKNLEQCCPRCYRQHCTWKILFYVAVILLRQHSTGKNPFQCRSGTPENIVEEKTQCNVTWTTSGHFWAIFILDHLIFW